MAGCVDNVNTVVVVLHRRHLRGNRNAALTLLVAAVHNERLTHFGLVIAEGLALFQQPIYQCCFPVVNMSNNCNIADFGGVLDVLCHKNQTLLASCLSKVTYIMA